MAQQQIVLHRYPAGFPEAEDFRLREGPIPEPGAGELLCRNRVLSLDPYLRGVISGRQLYAERVAPGDVMPGRTVAEVVASRSEAIPVGTPVVVPGGWQEYAVVDARQAWRIDGRWGPPSTRLGVLGMPGLTAWAGMHVLAAPRPGETVVVSAASGPVGATAGQLARERGCRVVGIAGGPGKSAWVRDEAGFAVCIDHRTEALAAGLERACPDGIDVYFDNVGGDVLAAVLGRLARGARVVLCGLVSQYNASEPPPGPNLGPVIAARAVLKGLVVYDYYDRCDEFLATVGPLVGAGTVRYREDWNDGLDAAPGAFARLMRGGNFGKTLVRIDRAPAGTQPAS